MVRIPTRRAPTHPGEMLLEEFLTALGISQRELADSLRVPYQRINELVSGRQSITPSTALRLARLFRRSERCAQASSFRQRLAQSRDQCHDEHRDGSADEPDQRAEVAPTRIAEVPTCAMPRRSRSPACCPLRCR